MNLTQIIAETGKRVRLGKTRDDQLTNAQIKQVLETAIEIVEETLLAEEHIEIQGFAILEVKRSTVSNPNTLITLDEQEKQLPSERVRFVFRPSRYLRDKIKNRS